MSKTTFFEEASHERYQQDRINHWNKAQVKKRLNASGPYHERLEEIFRFIIPNGKRVIELGCGEGDLLAAIKPSYGLGIDFSEKVLEIARQKHAGLSFICAEAHDYSNPEGLFDYVILSDLVNDLWDVQRVFENAAKLLKPTGHIVINVASRLWEHPLTVARAIGLARPVLQQNWFAPDDVVNLLGLSGFEVLRHWEEILLPFDAPFISNIANRYLTKVWPFSIFALSHIFVASLTPDSAKIKENPSVSVIVPAKNEAGNIPEILKRLPQMGSGTELIFVEGESKDDTSGAIEKAIKDYPDIRCLHFKQTGTGKGDAVRLGFSKASGDILMILDADMTVIPEDLPRFYEVIKSGQGRFVNGVRLVYPMEGEAMRFLNFIANKFFSIAFTWLLGQPIKDTLCGTKVLWREDEREIAENRAFFGDFDPFGDFDLLFGAARLNYKIVDVPIRYRDRTYGTTQISRWSHGWLLLKMVAFAARRIKFV